MQKANRKRVRNRKGRRGRWEDEGVSCCIIQLAFDKLIAQQAYHRIDFQRIRQTQPQKCTIQGTVQL